MRLNLYWRGIDLVDVEIHLFKPRDDGEEEPAWNRSDLSGTTDMIAERAEPFGDPDTSVQGNGWGDDDRARRRFGF